MAASLSEQIADADVAETAEAACKLLLGDLPLLLPFALPDRRPMATDRRWKHAGPDALVAWIEDSAMVRDRLEALADLVSSRGGAVPIRACQWGDGPPGAADPETDWIGGPLTEDDAYHARGGAVVVGEIDRNDGPIAGLFIDGWSESLPAPRGELAVVFDIDAPLARAPQTALLAVKSGAGSDWSPTEMLGTLTQVADEMQARTLAPFDWPARVPDAPAAGFLGASLPLMMLEEGVASVSAGFCPPGPEPDR
jgi:hypothetical protein